MNRTAVNLKEAKRLPAGIQTQLQSLPRRNTAGIRALRRKFTKELQAVTPEAILELSSKLISRGIELRFIAYELIAHHRAAARSLNTRKLERLGAGIDSWGAVDMFSVYLAGPAWREKQISDVVIRRWARSRDRWWRRAALVATVPLNSKAHGGTGDANRTLAICSSLVSDRDDMVVKAMSWALRELAKRDSQAVTRFIRKHRATLASRVVREVTNKIDTGLKNPRKAKTN